MKMMSNDAESKRELVLDNRKLILVFAVFIAICGCFFVVGFVEGKRQGFQEKALAASESTTVPAKPVEEPSPDVEPPPLDWYKSVRGNENTMPAPVLEPEPVAPVSETKPPAEVKKKSAAPAAGSVTYSVQVGAFRQLREVENKAKLLRSKGFECRTEEPQSPNDLYLLKVGMFKTRAEAVAMQLRLKKSGFPSFIKTNPPKN